MSLDDIGGRPSRLQIAVAVHADAGGRRYSPYAGPGARNHGEDGQHLRGHADRNSRDARHFGGNAGGPGQARRRSGSTWKTARWANLQIEGLDGTDAEGTRQARTLRARSRSISPDFMRLAAQFANPATTALARTDAPALIPLIQGVEIKDVTAPFKNTGKFVNLDGFDLSWGQFVGPDSKQSALNCEIDDAGRCGRSFHENARLRPGLDKRRRSIATSAWSGTRRRAASSLERSEARSQRAVESLGARLARQRAAASVFGQRRPGDRRGSADRSWRAGVDLARHRRRGSRDHAICPQSEHRPRRRAAAPSSRPST